MQKRTGTDRILRYGLIGLILTIVPFVSFLLQSIGESWVNFLSEILLDIGFFKFLLYTIALGLIIGGLINMRMALSGEIVYKSIRRICLFGLGGFLIPLLLMVLPAALINICFPVAFMINILSLPLLFYPLIGMAIGCIVNIYKAHVPD